MRKPSVLFINRVYPPQRGATGRVLRDLARSFAREGWQVTILTTGSKSIREHDGSINVVRVAGPLRPPGLAGYAWVWLRLMVAALRMPRADLLVTMTDPPLLVLAGQVLSRLRGMRHIHWCHDLYPDILPALGVRMPGPLLSCARRLVRRAMMRADKLIVIGRCMAGYLAGEGIDPRHITMIPNWPDPELSAESIEPAARQSRPFLHEAVDGSKPYDEQLKDGPKFRVLYAGNIGRAHPVDTILDAAEILGASNPEIEFVFVGDGPRFDLVLRERDRRGLGNIRFIPYQPAGRLRELMESGDVHIVSVNEDACGMLVPAKLYSALGVHRPCIFVGPAQSEAARVICDFGAGSVIAQGRAGDLADCIRRYRMNSDDWYAAHHGAAKAGGIYQPHDSIEAWMQRARAVVGHNPATGRRAA